MTAKEALQFAISQLKQANIATYHIDALIITKIALSISEVKLLTYPEIKLTDEQKKQLFNLIEKRKKFYPMAYITKHKEFYGFDFYVDERVLIPRPETELLVEETIKIAKTLPNPIIVDVGTGSGCIAITLSRLLGIHVIGLDISKDAIDVAKINKNRLEAKVSFAVGDKLTAIKRADIVVSNPPYITKQEYEKLSKDVKFEPRLALIDKNPNQFLKELIEQAKNKTHYLIVELGYNQSDFVRSFKECITIKRDLNGIERVAIFNFDR
ncbi:peptide chain release factor N(5)-glutamine methyltransferase [Hippea jasoniae]|uniref:peptide chain release factor N(5)-glutamine methyltransferase n=1 Tax=Hippea jasoniae TaxID=944479 RepID=UPI00054E3873|nr:peptide chain release factor N(5)-glutamine methyltransferase [Hippea jasoniae]